MNNCQLSGICLVRREKLLTERAVVASISRHPHCLPTRQQSAPRVRLRLLLKQGTSCLGSNLNLTRGAAFRMCVSKNSCRIKSVFPVGMSGFPEAKIKDYPQTLQILSIFLTTLFYKETISNFAFKLVGSYEMHQGKRG